MSAGIEDAYERRTPRSRALMERAARSLPGGSTRNFGDHRPYPVVIDRGEATWLWDIDGNRYVDLVYNGLSLIHGHRYPPIEQAMHASLERGTAWPGASQEQIRFAELLCTRIPTVERVRFTNTGTEAGMLAMKIARRVTGRPLLLKAWSGYHGSYDDLEVGFHGQGERPDRTLLATFGDPESFERVLDERGDRIAAVVLEPIMFAETVVPPPPHFLQRVQAAAQRAGALFVLDDCLMFRVAPGGSQELYHLKPDLTFLGKFIGGGVPVGAVGGPEEIMRVLDPRGKDPMFHGGSFNGNLLGSVAGRIAVEELTAERIGQMDRLCRRLRDELSHIARRVGVSVTVSGESSVAGVYLTSTAPGPGAPRAAVPDERLMHLFALACRNHGLYTGPGGQVAMATVITDDVLDLVIESYRAAFADLLPYIGRTNERSADDLADITSNAS